MSGLIIKSPHQDNTDEYWWVGQDALVKDNIEECYFTENDIIARIKENNEGYFDFSKNLVDIGACYGAYSMLLDFNHNYAFEPGKEKCCLIYANMYLKGKVNNTDVFNVALDEVDGTIKFNGFWCDGYSTFETAYGQHFDMYDVPARCLDDFSINNVGFIKIDVEGMEEKVLRGGFGTIIRNNYPPILFECWNVGDNGMTQEKHDSLFNTIKSLGYEILECWGQSDTHLAVHKNQLNK